MLSITGQLQDSQLEQSTQQLQQDDANIIMVANSPQPKTWLLERLATDQSKFPFFGAASQGRITASHFYRVYTKVETMKKNPNTGYETLLKSPVDPPPTSIPRCKSRWGNKSQMLWKNVAGNFYSTDHPSCLGKDGKLKKNAFTLVKSR